jgi:hypothetical protein
MAPGLREFLVVRNILFRIIGFGREHQQPGIFAKIMLLRPNAGRDIKAKLRSIEAMFLPFGAIVRGHDHGPRNRNQELAAPPVGVPAANGVLAGVEDKEIALWVKWQLPADLAKAQLAALVLHQRQRNCGGRGHERAMVPD